MPEPISHMLQWLNVLFVPLLGYTIKLESRLSRLEGELRTAVRLGSFHE